MKSSEPNGYEIVQNALSGQMALHELALRLVPAAIETGKTRIGARMNPECKTEYAENGVEIFLWSLALMCQEWILENLRRKSQDGHCWAHKQRDKKPCEEGSKFHSALYWECKESFEDVLKRSQAPDDFRSSNKV